MRSGPSRLVVGLCTGILVTTMLGACTRPRPGGPTTTVSTPPTQPGEPGASQKGPDPTDALITGARGPFPTATASASGGTGFGGGTIHYPTDTSQGRFGVLVVVPGFMNSGSVMAPYGQRIASHGFVVLIANTNTTSDLPASRANQLLAALDWLTTRSSVADRIDASRQAVAGYSMGGGGSLDATRRRGTLKAAIPMAPWNLTGNYSGVTVPTMVVTCVGDAVASPSTMGRPYYNSLSGPKAYFQMTSGNHACPLLSTQAIGTRMIVWLKRFVDDDTRYTRFLCPQPIAISGSTGWESARVC